MMIDERQKIRRRGDPVESGADGIGVPSYDFFAASKPNNRRQFIRACAFGAAAFTTPGLFAEQLIKTAHVGEGPFYPDKLPLDTDNDLLIINDRITPAVGEITHLSGRILTATGQAIRNAFVEIWQCDSNGAYIHSASDRNDNRDTNFQGYGRFLTDSKGQYYFRTIKPVPYTGRTPHIHFGISKNGKRIFTTQLLINGNAQNDRDRLFSRVTDQQVRQTILVDFNPIQESKFGELAANFDIVLGVTAEEMEDGKLAGGIGKRQVTGPRRGPGRRPGGFRRPN